MAFLRQEKGWWYVTYRDEFGRQKTKSAKTQDKSVAEAVLREFQNREALVSAGVVDRETVDQSNSKLLGIEEVLPKFQDAILGAKKEVTRNCRDKLSYIRAFAKHCSIRAIGEINEEHGITYMRSLAKRDLSPRGIQAHLGACKHFTSWLFSRKYLSNDPLSNIKAPNPDTEEPRQPRRYITTEEWPWFIKGTLSVDWGSDRSPGKKMSGAERVLLYWTAIATGFRRKELSLLKPHLFDFELGRVKLGAGLTKNKNKAFQQIPPSLCNDLKLYFAGRSKTGKAFDMPGESKCVTMIKADMTEARRLWIEEAEHKREARRREESDFLRLINFDGEHLVFHSLRHTCGTWLCLSGADIKTVQEVMRHQTIGMTMDRYGHHFKDREKEAVSRLDSFLSGE